jgi:hypothetical protein
VRDEREKKGIGGAESDADKIVKGCTANPLAEIFPKNARPAAILVPLDSFRNIQISFFEKI